MTSRTTHAVTNSKISFFELLNTISCVYVQTTLPLPIHPYLATVNNAAINIRLHISKILYFFRNSIDELKERMVNDSSYTKSLENNTLDGTCGKNLLKWTKLVTMTSSTFALSFFTGFRTYIEQPFCNDEGTWDGCSGLVHWEDPEGWGTHVNPWLIHVNVWQKPLQYCKVMSLQWIKINRKKKFILKKKKEKKKRFLERKMEKV